MKYSLQVKKVKKEGNKNPWSFGADSLWVGQSQETVNTAIVDIYDTDDNLDTSLKIQVAEHFSNQFLSTNLY